MGTSDAVWWSSSSDPDWNCLSRETASAEGSFGCCLVSTAKSYYMTVDGKVVASTGSLSPESIVEFNFDELLVFEVLEVVELLTGETSTVDTNDNA